MNKRLQLHGSYKINQRAHEILANFVFVHVSISIYLIRACIPTALLVREAKYGFLREKIDKSK